MVRQKYDSSSDSDDDKRLSRSVEALDIREELDWEEKRIRKEKMLKLKRKNRMKKSRSASEDSEDEDFQEPRRLSRSNEDLDIADSCHWEDKKERKKSQMVEKKLKHMQKKKNYSESSESEISSDEDFTERRHLNRSDEQLNIYESSNNEEERLKKEKMKREYVKKRRDHSAFKI